MVKKKVTSKKERLTGFTKLGFEYYFFFWVVLMIGNSTKFINSFDPRTHPFSFLFLIFCGIKLLNHTNRFNNTSNWRIVFVVLLPWIIYHYFVDYSFEYGTYAQFSIKIGIGLIFASFFKERLIEYYWKIIALLCLLSLPFWIISNIVGVQVIAKFAPFEQWLGEGSSFIIYNTLQNINVSDTLYSGIIRNSGFCWEPGRFATSIVFAMACCIINNGNSINWKSWQWIIMLVSLATTQSTTGYVAFLILILLYYMSNSYISLTKRLIGLSFLFVSFPILMSLPFMQNKIQSNVDSDSWLIERKEASWVEDADMALTVDRSEGVFLDYMNMLYKPVMGSGLSNKDTYLYNYISTNLTTSNGLTKPLSMLGLLIGIPFFIMFFVGLKKITKKYVSNQTNMLFIIAIVMQYSYNFMFDIFFLALICYGLQNNIRYINK